MLSCQNIEQILGPFFLVPAPTLVVKIDAVWDLKELATQSKRDLIFS